MKCIQCLVEIEDEDRQVCMDCSMDPNDIEAMLNYWQDVLRDECHDRNTHELMLAEEAHEHIRDLKKRLAQQV